MRIIALAAELARPATDLAATGNPNLRGDAQTAALLSQAAARSAGRLVAINLGGSPADIRAADPRPADPRPADPRPADPRLAEVARLLARIDRLAAETAPS